MSATLSSNTCVRVIKTAESKNDLKEKTMQGEDWNGEQGGEEMKREEMRD